MRILYINGFVPRENVPMGGIFVTKRIQALQKKGIQVFPYIYGVEYSKTVQKYLSIIRHIPPQSKPVCYQLDIEYQLRMSKMGFVSMAAASFLPCFYEHRITKMLERDSKGGKRADIIHLHWVWPVGIGVQKFCQKREIPYVITCHGSEINITMAEPRIQKAMVQVLENAAAVEFVSEALLKRAKELGYSGKNAAVIYNGIDGEIFGKILPTDTEKRAVVSFVGNLLPVKGADRLPKIFHRIYEKCPGAEFRVIGDGSLRSELEQKMQGLPVVFTGQISQERLAEEYAKSALLIVPSRNEGYPCAIKEAQSCGVIPVGCNVGGILEAMDGYGTAVSGTEKEIAEKLADIAVEYLEGKRQIDRRKMAEHAVKNTWEHMQELSVELYHKILKD